MGSAMPSQRYQSSSEAREETLINLTGSFLEANKWHNLNHCSILINARCVAVFK